MGNPEKVSVVWKDGKETVTTDFQHFIPEDEIIERTSVLAGQLTDHAANLVEHTHNIKRLHVIYIALGAFFWAGDLGREIGRAARRQNSGLEITFDTLRIATRGVGTKPSGHIQPLAELGKPRLLQDAHVVVIDEVADSGLTLDFVTDRIKRGVPEHKGSETIYYPSSVAIAALVDKPSVHNGRVTANYAGFAVSDNWLVGCGMDHEEQCRELPAIYQKAAEHRKDGTTYFELATSYSLPQAISPLIIAR